MSVVGSLALSQPGAQAQQVRQELPVPADAFVDSVGVSTHFSYLDTSYARSEELIDKLQDLGVRHVRDGLGSRTPPAVLDALRSLPEHGVRATLIMGSPGLNRGAPLPPAEQALQALSSNGLEGVVEAIEAPNEWDLRGGATWLGDLQDFQRELYERVRADPRWDGVPVIGPTVGRYRRIDQLRGFEELMDVVNLHNYPRGGPPEQTLEDELDAARAMAPGKPLWVTETGYHTALAQERASPPVPEQAKADYLVRTLLENFQAGVARTYLYQLVDERPEPAREDQEQHFGLLRSDLSETPAFEAVRDLLSELSDPGPAFAPRPLAVEVDADDAVQHLLVQKRDGSYRMVLWRRGLLHEGVREVSGSAPVSVTFDAPRTVGLQAGDVGSALGSARTVEGVIGDRPVVLEIDGSAAGGSGLTARFDDAAGAAAGPGGSGSADEPATVVPESGDDGAAVLVLGIALGVLLAALVGAAWLLHRARRSRRAAPADLPEEDEQMSRTGAPPR